MIVQWDSTGSMHAYGNELAIWLYYMVKLPNDASTDTLLYAY